MVMGHCQRVVSVAGLWTIDAAAVRGWWNAPRSPGSASMRLLRRLPSFDSFDIASTSGVAGRSLVQVRVRCWGGLDDDQVPSQMPN